MPLNDSAEAVIEVTADAPIAEVIKMPKAQTESFYVRNSGDLPRLGNETSSRYHRGSLPRPIESDSDSLVARIREFFSVNRPSRL